MSANSDDICSIPFRHDKANNIPNLLTSWNDDGDAVYRKSIANVPLWYRSTVTVFLAFLGVLGILLNGFVIWCFCQCETVGI